LSANAAEIACHVGTGSVLVEPGGGSCAKVHILLDGLKPTAYVPMDISKDHLRLSAQELSVAFPWLEIHAIYADFTRELRLPRSTPQGTHLAFFPGSSIGNFDPDGAFGFLTLIGDLVGSGGFLLIGVDVKKDKAVLEAAYDDAAGITAQFNLNLLTHINRELDANFDITAWRHSSVYNEQLGRIEMHLVSKHNQVVTINNTSFRFAEGETIHTENSYKYSTNEFITLASRAGFQSDALWVDADKLFSVHLFRVPQNHAK